LLEATSEFVLRVETEVENVSETVFLDLEIKIRKMREKVANRYENDHFRPVQDTFKKYLDTNTFWKNVSRYKYHLKNVSRYKYFLEKRI